VAQRFQGGCCPARRVRCGDIEALGTRTRGVEGLDAQPCAIPAVHHLVGIRPARGERGLASVKCGGVMPDNVVWPAGYY